MSWRLINSVMMACYVDRMDDDTRLWIMSPECQISYKECYIDIILLLNLYLYLPYLGLYNAQDFAQIL